MSINRLSECGVKMATIIVYVFGAIVGACVLSFGLDSPAIVYRIILGALAGLFTAFVTDGFLGFGSPL